MAFRNWEKRLVFRSEVIPFHSLKRSLLVVRFIRNTQTTAWTIHSFFFYRPFCMAENSTKTTAIPIFRKSGSMCFIANLIRVMWSRCQKRFPSPCRCTSVTIRLYCRWKFCWWTEDTTWWTLSFRLIVFSLEITVDFIFHHAAQKTLHGFISGPYWLVCDGNGRR